MIEPGTLLFEPQHTQVSDPRRASFKHAVCRSSFKTTTFRTRSTFLIRTAFCLRSPRATFRKVRRSLARPCKAEWLSAVVYPGLRPGLSQRGLSGPLVAGLVAGDGCGTL